jgi:hypothetical protein
MRMPVFRNELILRPSVSASAYASTPHAASAVAAAFALDFPARSFGHLLFCFSACLHLSACVSSSSKKLVVACPASMFLHELIKVLENYPGEAPLIRHHAFRHRWNELMWETIPDGHIFDLCSPPPAFRIQPRTFARFRSLLFLVS